MAVVWFLGVTTGGSLVHRAAAAWSEVLGEPLAIEGHDVEPDAPSGTYRSLLDAMLSRDDVAGAVVTAHKRALFEAAHDRFVALDWPARHCREVSAVRRVGRQLRGYARDPVSMGRIVDRIWPPHHGEDAVILGAGGSAIALGTHLMARADRPRLVFADARAEACAHVGCVLGDSIETRVGDGPWDDLVQTAAPGAVVVNATGMGKDRPGSPLSPTVTFPPAAVAWELNYRGDLRFLTQARGQAVGRQLTVHDGWSLFCHGWAAALAAVLGRADDGELGDAFERAVAELRLRTVPDPAG